MISAVVALIAALLFWRLHVPAGPMIGALVGVSAYNILVSKAPDIPAPLEFLALAALGWAIGQDVTLELLSTLKGVVVPMVLVIAFLVLAGVMVGAVLVRSGVADPATSYLAAFPGALSQMSALAKAAEADAPLVAAVHTFRVIAIIAISPIVLRIVTR